MSLLGMLWEKELWRGIPIPAGYTLSLAGVAGAQAVQIVTYDRYEPGDIRRDQPNGPESAELDYLSYGRLAAAAQAAGDYSYSVARSGAAFVQFPWVGSAPANTDTTIYGVLGSTYAPSGNTGSVATGTEYLRFTDERRVLGDRQRHGYAFVAPLVASSPAIVGGGPSHIGNYSDVDRRSPMMFDPPLTFSGGEELNVELEVAALGAGKSMSVDATEIALIMRTMRR